MSHLCLNDLLVSMMVIMVETFPHSGIFPFELFMNNKHDPVVLMYQMHVESIHGKREAASLDYKIKVNEIMIFKCII